MKSELYNEDCLDRLKKIPSESVDLVVTDCPYHIVSGGRTKAKSSFCKETGGMLSKRVVGKNRNGYILEGTKRIALYGVLNDNDAETYTKQGKLFKYNEIKFEEWLPEVYRVLKNQSHCYIYISPRNLKDLQVAAEKAGFIFQQLIVWDKGNAVVNKYYLNAYELVLMLRKGNAKNINNKGTKNLIRVPNIIGTKSHPTEKPVSLNEIFIANSSSVGGGWY